ncbi:MAG TPA: amino acid adenylation domain-containing protein, partial [Thermoanaerobaculia bacterium]|nr:amino acid adenylation domain-containing protein [Thermoanaerobaculia bacterium]
AVLDWWRERLAGLPTLELPMDRPRPAVQTYRGDTHRLRLSGELAAALRTRSRAQHGTLFMTLAAAFQALLGRLSGQEDVAIGTARSGRTHAQVAGTVGYFVNQVVLRGDLTGDPTFAELLERTKAVVQDAFAQGDYPLPLLAEHLQPERDASRTPLFQVSFVLQKETRGAEGLTAFALGEEGVEVGPQDFRLESMSLPQPPSPFDLVLHCVERQGGLSLALQYNTDLFDATTTELLLERFERLLEAVAADPRQRLSELPLLSAAEREQLLLEWNDTAVPPQQPAPLVHELVAEQARRQPEALAVATPESRITYGELASRARQLAATLGRLGVGPEVRVALCAGQAVERAVGGFAVLTAGGAYVLLDPEAPPERLAFQVGDSRAAVVLTERALAGRFASCDARLVDIAEARGEESALPFPAAAADPDNLAYVVYTSGSTGLPKGVAVPHAGLLNLVRWHGAAYGVGPGDRATLIANPAFDASVWELWPYLAAGASVHVPAAETRLAPREIVRFWRSEGITWSFLPTPLAEEVMAEGAAGELSLKGLLCGGDRLHQVPGPHLPFSLINHYGPSEVSVVSTSAVVLPETPGLPPIGRPIHNLRTRVVDAWGVLAPRGAVGELWIGGVGLARGYLDRPALTAERFVPDPWSGAAGERLYRSGDRVRLRPDGSLEFLGRIDHQIKLRGFRIEPGEIEAALRAHPAVAEAAVALHQGRLVAYVVLNRTDRSDPSDRSDLRSMLRDSLRERLPEFMLPAAWSFLPELPRTPNGKVDRRALERLAPALGGTEAGSAAPRTPAEELMAGIFAEVLGIERIGVEESFFEQGGHSLAALRLSARIREAFGVELPLHRVFETPTVAALAAEIEGGAPLLPPLIPTPRDQPMPLSFAQQRLWFLHQLEPESPAYNIPVALHLRGRLDGAVLAASLGELARRHETLRTRFMAEPGGPVQVIDPPAPVPLPEIDLVGLSADEGRRLARAEALRPFDLMRGPAWRTTLARLGPEEHLLLLTLHHIVGDGWSLRVLARELGEIYGALAEGRPSPLPELEVQYGDYAVWQRGWLQGEVLEAELAHWRSRLAGAPPVLDLPLDRPRTAAVGERGASRPLALPPGLLPGLQGLARRQGVTLFMAVLAAVQALLARVSGSEDVSVGTPVAGRSQIRTEGLIGFFANMLVMRTDLSGDPPFTGLLARAREVALAAYAHHDLPFDKLVEELHPHRELGVTPLFQVSLTLDGEPPPSLRLGAAEGTPWRMEQETEKFDLGLTLEVDAEGLTGTLGFRTDLFDGATAERLAEGFGRLLAGAVADPRRRVSELPLLSDLERTQLLVEWSGAATDYPREATIHGLFAEQAALRPGAVAVVGTEESLTYGELRHRAGALARRLRRLGVGPEVRVGVCLERSPERVVATLAVLEAGGVYVPLDPGYPRERLEFLLADAGVRVVLVHEPTRARMAELASGCTLVEVKDSKDLNDSKDRGPTLKSLVGGGTALAYVMYTSGSTGEPKGVAVPHRAVVRLVRETGFARFGPDEVFLQLAPYSFDASTLEIWGALLNGGRLVMPPPGVLAPAELGELLSQHRVTTLWLTAGLFHQMVEENLPGLTGMHQLLAGGDVLSVPHVRRVLEELPGTRLINGYGPTENTTFTCCYPVTGQDGLQGSVPLGGPIANTWVYVLDRHLAPVPAGVAGELLTGGDGLARGYLGRPDRTAERFVPDPFGREAGGRLYRTGDLVRWRPAGTLEFLGRIDTQVKIRGFRVEPGEIEAALLAHSWVREAVVLAQREASGSQRLVAYVVFHRTDPSDPSDRSDPKPVLAASLHARLPEFMLPAAWVFLPSLPLTANGKVDRRALANLRPERPEVSAADAVPRTAFEERVARIYAEVLGLERVGREDDFFDLGGHSLLATQVASRVRAAFGVELPVRVVFEEPTVAGLAAWLEGSTPAGDRSRMQARASLREAPLSFAQQRLWFLAQMEPGSPLYNIALAVELRGRLEPVTLAAALGEVVRRHEALRTTFRVVADEPVQAVADDAGFALPRIDLAGLPEAAREEEAGRLASAEARMPFDLGRGPLLRAALLRAEGERHVLLLTMHHIVSDGWSLGVLVRELGALYGAFLEGRPSPLPELALQYADFAAWQRQHLTDALLEPEIAWWRERLAGMPPALDLPVDHPWPAARSVRGAVHDFAIDGEELAALQELSRQHGATLFMTLFAGFAALLSRWTGQSDLGVGTPIAGRTRVETEPLIGLFVNTLVLRADLAGDPGFADFLDRVRETTLSAYAHQDVPFERLVEELAPQRDLSRPPLAQVLFALQNATSGPLELPGLALTATSVSTETARLELSCLLTETERGLDGMVEYSRDLFEEATIARLVEHLARLLAGAAAEPGRRASELPMMSAEERRQLLVEWGDTGTRTVTDGTLHGLFEAQAARTPEAVALVDGHTGESWTYRELDERSEALARQLVDLGVGPEVRVAVRLPRTPQLVASLFAVLKAGGAYVPLDPEYPRERLDFLLDDSGAAVLITEEGAELLREPARSATPAADPESLAYLIYTSGSTGRPKAVAIEHRSAVAFAHWARTVFTPDDLAGVLASTSVSFDLSVFEIFVTLAWGGKIVLAVNALELPHLDAAGEVTLINTVPSAMAELVRQGAVPESVRTINLAGEPLKRSLVDAIYATTSAARVLDLYGPSESTTYSTWAPAPRGVRRDPAIGRPIAGTRAVLLGRSGELVPAGVAGELLLGGAGLARGYLNRPDLTAERFVPDPFAAEPGERLYRTGDLARWLPGGRLEYLGRIDQQVKVRGFRVEPGEIEAALSRHPAVREAVVLAREDVLVAYVAAADGAAPEASELRDFLRAWLPEFLLPAACTVLPELPLTANGKVDRRALARLRLERPAGVAPRTPTEELVAGIFAELLGMERVGITESFFALGGHSLLATQVASRVRSVFGVELPVRSFLEAPTVEGLAGWIERSARGAAVERIVRVSREEPLALSFAQQRLWFLDQLEPGGIVYNIPVAVELKGQLDAGAMTAAFGEVVRRHEVLRTTFREVAGDPVQVVAEPAGFSLPLIDLADLPAPEREREASRLASAEARRPFDLEAGPLLRAALLGSAADRHLLLVTMHHIVSDGWSMGVLVRELGALYAAFREGRPSPLPALAIQYADFAAWQRRHLSGDLVEAELTWWTDQLAGIPPALEMPTDHPRPAVSSLRGAVHGFTVSAEDLAGLNRLSRRHGATLFMTLLAGFAALLQRASGQRDVVMGTPIAGRTRIETEPLIGFFVNTLALRTDLSGSPSFLDLLARMRETTLAAYAHQELPFERLVEELAPERDRSRTPIFQAMLAFQNNASAPLALPGVEVEVQALTTGTAKFDLNLILSETARGLAGMIEYSRDLFDSATIARLTGHFARLMTAAAADPRRALAELPLLSDGERHQLLAEWNDTRAPFPETMLLHQFFEAAVERNPEAIAAAGAGRELTYAELDARSNRLAYLLRNAGIDRGAPVGVWVERSLDMLTAVLGVLKAGGHYVALDEAWPADRVESILAATGAPAIVAGAGLLGAVEEMRWRLPALSDAVCLAFCDPEPPAEAIDPESVRALWDFVAERAVDRVTAGGFVSAFTGEPMSEAEVDEYRDRVLSLASPWLRPDARVLEIGNGSGLLLREMASRVAHVTGVDPSPLTQERNKEHAAQEGIANVALLTGFAHEVDGLLGADERFDLILLASTVQFFPGPRYLERMVRQALGRLAPGGALLIADVLDARRREELRQVTDEHRRERGLEPAAPRRELFLDEDLFRDLGGAVHHRTAGSPNELGFRYDVLLTGEPAVRRKRVWTGWHVDRCLSARLPQLAAPEDVAYVIHTSGSTGEPKGIVVQHRPAANLVDWVNRTFEVGPADRGLFVTSLCFDLSVWDIFGMLAAGGTVHVATRDELADPDHLVRLLRTGGITVWDSAPAALLQLAPLFPAEPDAGSRLRRVLLSGDWIPVTLPDRVRQSFPGARVMALGGATEATVWSNWFPVGVVDPDWPSIPYGRPMANAR